MGKQLIGADKCKHHWQLKAGEMYVCDDCNTWWPDWANTHIQELQQEVERLQSKVVRLQEMHSAEEKGDE